MSATVRSADGYPIRPSDPDFEIQEAISRTLQTCRAASAMHSTVGELYPEVLKLKHRAGGAWLGPILQRLDWNLRQNHPEGETWAAYFGPMLSLVLPSVSSATEEQLFFLCEWAGFLGNHHCHYLVDKISEFALHLERGPGLSRLSVDQVRKVFGPPAPIGAGYPAQFRTGWTLFLARNNPDDGDPCWTALVRRDLREMPKKQREAWLALLDTNDHAFHIPKVLPKPTGKKLGAIDAAEFAEVVDRWTSFLTRMDSVQLSFAGVTLLNFLLRLCNEAPSAAVDEALYRIAGARWAAADPRADLGPDPTGWMAAYLMTLSARPSPKAFACAEALMMNPATKDLREVRRIYNTLASAASASDVPPARATTGVDGFAVEAGHPYAAEHALIDRFLREVSPDLMFGKHGAPSLDAAGPLRASLLQAAASLPDFVRALSERVAWLAQRCPELPEKARLFWRVETGNLMGDLLRKIKEPPQEVLIDALHSDSLGFFGSCPSSTLLGLCQGHVERHGWNAGLLAAIKPWVKTLHGSNAAQDMRRKAGWMLWFEDVDPIRADECWSNCIRADLRGMPAAGKTAWLALLRNASFAIADKPPAKWMKPAKAAFQGLGGDKFRARYRAWFEPFRAGKPLRLTIAGRDVLRLLVWYAMVAEDPAVDEALAWLGGAQWKTKDAADRAAKVETALSYVLVQRDPSAAREAFGKLVQSGRAYAGSKVHAAYQELCRQDGEAPVAARQPERTSPDLDALKAAMFSRMKEAMAQQLGTGCTWDGDTLVVVTPGDTFRIDSVSGRVTRVSDGAVIRVEIPFDQVQYRIFKDQIDGHDLRNPGQPNLMRAALCAQIVQRQSEGSRQLVVDTTAD